LRQLQHRLQDAQACTLTGNPRLYQSACHSGPQFVATEWLGHKVDCPSAQRLNRIIQRSQAGDDDGGDVQPQGRDAIHQVETGHPRHADIGQEQVKGFFGK
jgi:hypothetical protein